MAFGGKPPPGGRVWAGAHASYGAAGVEGALRGYFEAARPRGVVSAYLFGSLAQGTADAFTRTAPLRQADVRPFLERTRRLKLEALAR